MFEAGSIVAVMVAVAVDGPYSYRVPDGAAVERGSIVVVPLGPRPTLGVVWGAPKDNFAHNRLKDIAEVFDLPPLPDELLKTVDWVARYTLAQPGMVLRGVLRSREALDPPRPVIALKRTGELPERLTPARSRVLDAFDDEFGEVWAKSALVGATGVSPSVIDGLIRAGVLEALEIAAPPPVLPPDPDFAPAKLSDAQQAGLEKIRAHDKGGFSVALLDGITGSGKTEVFFESVADALRAGPQVAIILPEIALTHTFLERFERRFGHRAAEWHSEMTPVQRARVWRGVLTGQVRAVIGARSALFLPFRELGLLVLDEEHDGAFKQADRVNYHGRDMAVVRASIAGARVILRLSSSPSEQRIRRQIECPSTRSPTS